MRILSQIAAVVLAAAPLAAQAQSIYSTGGSFVTSALVAGYTEPDGTRIAGLVLEMRPGWKTYWRTPGEAGVPPSFDWSASENLARLEIEWPRPVVFESFGMTTIGYGGQVVLPLRITPVDVDAPVKLAVGLDIGVCREICVFESAQLAHTLVPGLDEYAWLVQEARAAVPGPGALVGLESVVCRIGGEGRERSFEAELHFDKPMPEAMVVVEGADGMWFHGAKTVASGEILQVRAELSLIEEAAWIGRDAVRMTVLAKDMAADVRGC